MLGKKSDKAPALSRRKRKAFGNPESVANMAEYSSYGYADERTDANWMGLVKTLVEAESIDKGATVKSTADLRKRVDAILNNRKPH